MFRIDRSRALFRSAPAAGAALILAAATAGTAEAACPIGAGQVVHVSPSNGALDVARFPLISASFADPIPANEATLGECVRVVDRTGVPVPLLVRRAGGDDRVAVAVPATAADRLEPAEDYFLEIRTGDPDPSLYARTRFQTGTLKSVVCLKEDSGEWVNRCDETYWRDDPAIGLSSCGVSDPGNPCTCTVTSNLILGGRQASCTCTEEAGLLSASPDPFAVVAAVEPAEGGRLEPPDLTAPIVARLSGDLGASASLYTATVEDVTHGDATPSPVSYTTFTWDGASREFRIEGAALAVDRRYRVGIGLSGPAAPSSGAPRLLGPEAHGFSWTFHTRTGPDGGILETLPRPRTDRVSFPTHLPPWPHLRIVTDGPLTAAGAATGEPLFRIEKHDGTDVHGLATWRDVDLHRIHLMVYETLEEGQRYDVFCTHSTALAVGDPSCETTPVATFLTYVTPPEAAITDVRDGGWPTLEPAGEIWLPARPTVLNHPHGYKERYATDAAGPVSFLGHVMLVPPSPSVIGEITVDPAAGCLTLDPQPDPRCDGGGFYHASAVSCVDNMDCPAGTTCEDCPDPGNAGCPALARRCRYSKADYQTRLTSFCRDVIDNGFGACNVQDAIRCTIGGTDACAYAWKNRMNASIEAECPSTHRLHSPNNCVPEGRLALRLAPGEHNAYFEISGGGAVSWDATLGAFVSHTSPVVIEPSTIGSHTVFASTVPLPASGLPIPGDVCRTAGGPSDGYVCQDNLGVCHEPSWDCLPAEQGQTACATDLDCLDGFRCDSTVGVCVIDGNSAAFTCTGGDPVNPEIGGECEAEWVQIDAAWNIWRLWWPHHPDSAGSRRYNFAARIAGAAGGPFAQLPVFISTAPDYDVCDSAADPAACVIQECDDWNDLDYAAQVDATVDRLRSASAPAPLGVWAVGYRTLKGSVTDPSTQTCALSQVGGNSNDPQQDGAQGLFVKLPPGESPSDYRIEGSRNHLLANFHGGFDVAVRGLAFQGFPQPFYATDVEGLSLRGNQFLSKGSSQVLGIWGTSREVSLSDNYHFATGTADQRATNANARIVNNVNWKVQNKQHSSFYGGDMRATPATCTDATDPACVLPPCAADFDCRIPFMDSAGIMTADPAEAGIGPTCDGIDPVSGIGTCSRGVTDQTLFMDNVLLDGEGPNNGPWYTFRMQRNHLENGATQESFDGGGGIAWVWLMDNQSYNAASTLNHMILQNWRPSGQEWFLRAASVENNLLVKNAREIMAQHSRTGKIYPRKASATTISIENKVGPDGADGTGARVIGNTVRERVSAFDWGAGISGGLALVNSPGTAALDNTILSETKAAINVFDRDPVSLLTDGEIDGNLVFPNSRSTYADNICDSQIIPDISKVPTTPIRICDNASWRPDADRDGSCSYLTLSDDFRRHGLVEPFPYSYPLDMETMQRRIVATPEAHWASYRQWPVYDPAQGDDAVQSRPSRAACAYGDAAPGACSDPDADRDLYHDAGDNCPLAFNPDQSNVDGDAQGDACDPDDDGDGLLDGADCAPLDFGTDPPAEVAGLLAANGVPAAGGATRLSWPVQGLSSEYDVVSGLASELRIDGGIHAAVCQVDHHPATFWDDPRAEPPPGDAHYYVIRARNGCGTGTYGAGRTPSIDCP